MKYMDIKAGVGFSWSSAVAVRPGRDSLPVHRESLQKQNKLIRSSDCCPPPKEPPVL